MQLHLCSSVASMKGLSIQRRVLFGLLKALNLLLGTCVLSCPLSSLPLQSRLHSTLSIRCLSLSVPALAFLQFVTPPLLLHAWLLAGPDLCRAGAHSLAGSLSLVVLPWMKSRDKYVCGSKSIPAITVTD